MYFFIFLVKFCRYFWSLGIYLHIRLSKDNFSLEYFLLVMAGGIDTSQRKPRQLRGTPAYKFGNRFAAAVVTFGVVSGLLIKYVIKFEL